VTAGATKGEVADVSARDAWDHLTADLGAQLIDVRTHAEWLFVGVPDLASIGRQPVLLEWQRYPDNQPNTAFVTDCSAALAARGAEASAPLYFVCRSGARSRSAAAAMAAAGYSRCHNVADGFEGPLDARHHRGSRGWKADGLPWVQG
jgi:rhodanese-related sulfurtransferase